ncbi:MAG: fibronectin type III domain-containing protein [Candidatus Zixiibacteriota bacterium]|nr:MAG: fibronectin type III domain-containing protein [candidate division Zixibacteria bacterium]
MDSLRHTTRLLTRAVRLAQIAAATIILYTPCVHASLTAPGATPNSVTLSWTAPGDDGGVGTATVYDVRYSTSYITDANWDQATQVAGEPAPQPAGSAETLTVTGLDPSTTYYFAVKTADEVPNWSPLSNVATITTEPEQEAPGNIADLQVLESLRYSVLLGWTAPGDDGDSGTAAAYDIRYWSAMITEANWDSALQVDNEPVPGPAGTPESCTVADLNESTVYYFAIKTADEVPNWSGLSNVVTTSTSGDETPPSAVEDLEVASGDNDGEIDLSWTAPGDDGLFGTAHHYEIRYSLNMISPQNWDSCAACPSPPSPLAGGDAQAFTLCELEPGQMYYVALKAFDEAGNPAPISNIDSAVAYYSIISDVDDEDALPTEFALSQNYPNPFNPETEIHFSLAADCNVRLEIFNALGQKITTLVDRQLPAGNHAARWDGTTSAGQSAATGVYFYRLQAENFLDSKKMVLLK